MGHVSYLKELFESKLDNTEKVLLIFLIKKDVDFLQECRFLKININGLNKEFKNILMDQNDIT